VYNEREDRGCSSKMDLPLSVARVETVVRLCVWIVQARVLSGSERTWSERRKVRTNTTQTPTMVVVE
jgi:hypothetical protein